MERAHLYLYGEHDNLTSAETVSAFAHRHHANHAVMPGGECRFHTAEQMRFPDDWLKRMEAERSAENVPS